MKKLLFTILALFSINAYADADWLTPDGMTKVMEGVDDGTFHVSLGHTFPYYGGIFTDAWMSSNGVIILYDPTTQFGNQQYNNSMCCSGVDLTAGNAWEGFSFMLAPLWTDLRDANLTPTDGYYYQTDKGGSSFLWYNVTEFGTQNLNTFQANLWPDGSFDFLYDDVNVTNHQVTIGFSGDLGSGDAQQMVHQYGFNNNDLLSGNWWDQLVNPGGVIWYGQDGGYESSLDCSNALNDPQCPGYEEAYYDQQCSSDPLYDSGCQGYEQAYYDQQCSYDDLYDQGCPGYQGAIAAQDAAGTDFIFGDDISDFYNTEPEPIIEEPMTFFSSGNETDMFASYEEETNMFPEPEIYEESIEETFFEEPINDVFFNEPMMAAVEEEAYEEEIFEEVIEEPEYIEEQIAHVEEDIGNNDDEITYVEEDVTSIEEEISVADLSREIAEIEAEVESSSSTPTSVDAVAIALDTASDAESSSLSSSAQHNALSMSLDTSTSLDASSASADQVESSSLSSSAQQNEASSISLDTSASLDASSASADQVESSSLSLDTPQNDFSILSTQSFVTDNTASQAETSLSQVTSIVEQQILSQETNLQNFSASVALIDDVQGTFSDNLNEDLSVDNSEIALYDNNTFGSADSAFGDAMLDMMVDPSITVVDISAVQTVTEQVTQEESSVEFQMESSIAQTDTGFAAQQDQSFSTGQSITAVLNNVAPNYSQFDVAPPSQQEQQTTQRADAQADNMSEEQLEQNLDEFAADMQESGGFTDQSLTVFLMGRNSGFSQYEGQLQDVSFYTDRGMPGGRVQNDRNSMLQLIGTSGKHEEMISGQYR